MFLASNYRRFCRIWCNLKYNSEFLSSHARCWLLIDPVSSHRWGPRAEGRTLGDVERTRPSPPLFSQRSVRFWSRDFFYFPAVFLHVRQSKVGKTLLENWRKANRMLWSRYFFIQNQTVFTTKFLQLKFLTSSAPVRTPARSDPS